ncbi:hypothetical protein HMPREF0591_2636 [Mycobacterium parascrofulaceum ATCC BAA-614]|uniref:Uncharacterized protein n=1 Tax=Mycobacterium parascrofulaceum ATCC BAA-614 TaxID=525368 RepID=D5P8Z2_9MYCO|nr:hypothetical protein HMPREF0591_2636 [Mycobacterium parascrofulaceum ATCC BAA-614]
MARRRANRIAGRRRAHRVPRRMRAGPSFVMGSILSVVRAFLNHGGAAGA